MGNVREKPFVDIFRQSVFWDVLNDRTRRLHHCEVCRFRDYCGGCRARADAYYGQLHAGDPGCVFNARHWDKLVEDGVAIVEQDTSEEMESIPLRRHGFA
jgi:sulfatase maturation enzyme AslB (radical SAM superfamily)